jgi:serine/threonine protein kinase
MLADDHSFSKDPDEGRRRQEVRPKEPAPSSSVDRATTDTDNLMPDSLETHRLPALVEMVKLDLNRQWLQGRPVDLESYLEAFPELGTVETISPELILAEYEIRRQSGESVDLAKLEERFPRQAEELRRLIDQQVEEPATGSVLGRLGEMIAKTRFLPLSMARGAKAAPELPRRFGRYRIIKELGRGSMGAVYLVHDTQLARQVALKVPHFRTEDDTGTLDRQTLDRFYREAHAAAILDHPNLCPVYDVGRIRGIPYLTMAYIKGRPLSQLINHAKPLPLRRVAVLVRKLALALQVAHDKGVIHRDLKPSNIMICAGREPVIMDFGLAWRLANRSDDQRLTRLGLVLGTPAYMSPEQLSGRVEDLGPGCDIYSLGVILYELLTGRCPFDGPEAVVLGQVLFIEPGRPSSHRPDLDPGLEAICLKAMEKQIDVRYATMSELAAALGDYLRCNPLLGPRSSTSAVSIPHSLDETRPDEAQVYDQASPRPDLSPGVGPPTEQVSECPIEVIAPSGLRKAWHRWTRVVEIFALGLRSRRSPNQRAYESLHQQLLQTIRARAAVAEGPERDLYQELEELVTPWVSLRSLAREDREILGDLLAHCQHVERILKGPPASVTREVWVAMGLIGLAGVFALLFWSWVAS